ncbi:MAG: hypothetical protein HFF84_12465 [Oscillibacter sp.]|nr:hypothetical protein [Oscillibacter sp.]
MLRKLIKHEFRATGRIMLPLYLVLLATAVGANLSARGMLETRYVALDILGSLLVVAFTLAIIGVFVMAFVLMLQRFYKNLLQDEGYLMMTLPVSIHQHLWAKLIVSAVWFAATVLAVLLASMVAAYDVGVFKEFLLIFREFFLGLRMLKISEALNGTVILAEAVVLLFLAMVAFSLQFYAALAVGHSYPNHKMALSVAFFFGFQFVIQFLGSMLVIGLDKIGAFHFLDRWTLTPAASVHVGLLICIVGVVIYGAIFYGITTLFLKKRLNLE